MTLKEIVATLGTTDLQGFAHLKTHLEALLTAKAVRLDYEIDKYYSLIDADTLKKFEEVTDREYYRMTY